MSNVVNARMTQSHNIDALNRTAVCEKDLDNGSVFTLKEYSKNEGEGLVWKAEAPTTDTEKDIWMAISPEKVLVRDAMGNYYGNITPDPRAFVNYKGMMIDAVKLKQGDVIEMTGDGIENIENPSNKYLVINNGQFTLKAQTSATTGFCLKKIQDSKLMIGTGNIARTPVKTYVYVCEIN